MAVRKRRRRRRGGREQVFEPVFHAGKRLPKLTRPTYWARRARSTEFGKVVTKAAIRFRNPYTGWEGDAEQIAMEMATKEVERILDEELLDPDWEDVFDSPEQALAEALSEQHAEGIWQDRRIVLAIRNAGFDGIISNDPFGGEEEFVTFYPDQVEILETYTI